MKAIVYDHYGPPNVLHIEDVPKPVPEDDEVLIRVRAAEATKADTEMRSFRFAVNWFWLPLRLAFGVRRPKRKILGGYFAGEVVAVGKDVTRLAVGDEVYGTAGIRFGAYGEYVSLPARYTIVPKPTNMSFVEAAAVPLGALNALHFLRLADIQKGEKVLINGAGGSIGAYGIQIAKAMGAEVTAVDKGIKEDFIRRMGADHFVDYQTEDFTAKNERYDVIFDMVPGSSYSGCVRLLKPNGRYLTGNPTFSFMLRSVFTTWFSDKTVLFWFAGESEEDLLALNTMI